MNKIYKFALPLVALALTACGDNPFIDEQDGEMGQLSTRNLMLQVDNDETVVQTRAIDVDAFMVDIVKQTTGETVESFRYGQMPEIIALPAGTYTVKAHSGENPDAAWETPYYMGSTDVEVVARQVSDVATVFCKFANVRVSVYYDDDLRQAMSEDSKVNVKVGQNGSLDFAKSETRSGYFAYSEGSHTLVAQFTGTVDGAVREDLKFERDVEPGKHYKITYRYKNADAPDINGDISLGVSGIVINAYVEVTDLGVDIAIEDDPTLDDTDRPTNGEEDNPGGGNTDPVDPPTPAGPTVTPEAPLTFDSVVEVVDGMKAVILVHSDTGITAFKVVIDSEAITADDLEEVGLGGTLDLVNPGSMESGLTNLGLPVNIAGQTDVTFDISKFMGLLKALGSGTHKFILTVSDAGGTVTKTLTLHT